MGYKKKYLEQYEYIADCMEIDCVEDASVEEKLKNFVDAFEHFSTEWKRQNFPGTASRIDDMLRGLPQSCSVDFETFRIFKLGQEWGYVSKDITTEDLDEILGYRDARRFVNGWYRFIADRIVEMLDYYEIEVH